MFTEIAKSRRARPPPLRLVRDELRGVRPRCRRRPRGDRPEGDGVPDERRDAARAGAHRGCRERQAERLPRRAQGPLRRAAEHRVVAGARARGRPRGLRLPQPEDPREGDTRRPPGGRRPEALRPHRHRELPLGHGAGLRGLRSLHGRPGDHRGRREPLQLRHRLRQAGGVPQAARRPVQPPRPPDRGDPQGRPGGRVEEEGADPPEGQQPERQGDHRRALPRLAGRARRST